MKPRRYLKGEPIRSVSEIVDAYIKGEHLMFVCDKVIPVGFYQNWSIRQMSRSIGLLWRVRENPEWTAKEGGRGQETAETVHPLSAETH